MHQRSSGRASYIRPAFVEFSVHQDDRGSLVAIEESKGVPFPIRRAYYIFGCGEGVRRGLHAHRKTTQVAICVCGSCRFLLDDGRNRVEVVLDTRTRGLVIEPMVWHEMFDFSQDSVVLVLASERYDESDYLRRYVDFLAALQ